MFFQDQSSQQVLHVQHADDVIEVAVEGRVAGVAMGEEKAAQVGRRGAHGDADHTHTWHHDFGSREIAELKQFTDELSGFGAKRTTGLALLDDELEFFRRIRLFAGVLLPSASVTTVSNIRSLTT